MYIPRHVKYTNYGQSLMELEYFRQNLENC